MGRSTQQRGGSQPTGQELLQRIYNLEKALGIQGSNPNAFFAVRDVNGIQRVRVGFLPNGDYGIWFSDPLGNVQELFPVSASSVAGTVTCPSSGGIFSTGPEVVAYVGASGKALVRISAQAVNNIIGGAADGIISVALDGVNLSTSGPEITAFQGGTIGDTYSQMNELVLSGLVTGEHTFQMYGNPGAGNTSSIAKSTLVVESL